MIGNDYRAEKLGRMQTKHEEVREDYREAQYIERARTLGPEVTAHQLTLGEHLEQQRTVLEELHKCVDMLEERLCPILMGHPVEGSKEGQPVSNDSHLVIATRANNSYIVNIINRINNIRNNIQL